MYSDRLFVHAIRAALQHFDNADLQRQPHMKPAIEKARSMLAPILTDEVGSLGLDVETTLTPEAKDAISTWLQSRLGEVWNSKSLSI